MWLNAARMDAVSQMFSQWKLLWYKSSTEHPQSEPPIASFNSKEINAYIFITCYSVKYATFLYLCCTFTVWVTIYCSRKSFFFLHGQWRPLKEWLFIQISQKPTVRVDVSSLQWSGKSQVELSLKKHFDSRLSNRFFSCCWRFRTAGECPFDTQQHLNVTVASHFKHVAMLYL